jgi:hypothetical protein
VSPDGQPAESLLGAVLDGLYRIEGLLGEGGMGAVYEATQLRLDRRVAVKVMARELTVNPEALERFRREARVTSALGHPHIVQVSDFSVTPSGEPFLVMELLEGEDLERRLRRVGRILPGDVVSIVKQVASALAAAHAKGIVHRDLKPGNIYLLAVAGEPDFVKVLDFGISKVRTATTKLTRTASIIGTPNYMSPEQAKGKTEDIDDRTDQWALACIAWECLSGESPFLGENVPSILFQIVHEPPPSLLPKLPGLPPQVENVLVRALAKKKEERFPSVSEFAAAMEAALTGAAEVHSATAVLPARTIRLPDSEENAPATRRSTTFEQTAGEMDRGRHKSPTRPKWMWGAMGAAAAVAVTTVLWLSRSGSPPKPTTAALHPPKAAATAPASLPPPPPAPVPKIEMPAAAPDQEDAQPSQPAAAVFPAASPREPIDDAKALGRKRESKRKLPGISPAAAHASEAASAPTSTATENDHPFDTKARSFAPPRYAPRSRSTDDPFEPKARAASPPTRPSPPKLKDWNNATPPKAETSKPSKPRNKEDRWRVD